MSTQTHQFGVMLTSQSDWEVWFHRLELKAFALSIWDIIKPENQPAVTTRNRSPTAIPEPDSTAESTAGDTASASVTLLTEPEYPALEDAHYERKYRLFVFKMKEYETQQKALQSIAEFIYQTVSGNLLLILKNKYTVKDQVAALHHRFKLSPAVKNKQARDAWKKALQTPKKQGLETWLDNLLAAHTNLANLGLPEAENSSAVEALLSSVSPIAPVGWVEEVVSDQLKGENLIFGDLLVNFRLMYQMINALKGTQPQKGAFATNTNQSKQKTLEKPCLCGDVHRFSACPYLHPILRTTGWEANQQIQATIDRKLRDSWKLRNSVKNSKRYVQKPKSTQNRLEGLTNTSADKYIKNAFTKSKATTFSAQHRHHFDLLRDSWVYDTGSDIHVTNTRTAFTETRKVRNEWLSVGSQQVGIEAYGEVIIPVNGHMETEYLKLSNVAYIPDFPTNLVSGKLLKPHGVYLNTYNNLILAAAAKAPEGRSLIPTKWVFKVKLDRKYKARLVAQGDKQKVGIDYKKSKVTNLWVVISAKFADLYLHLIVHKSWPVFLETVHMSGHHSNQCPKPRDAAKINAKISPKRAANRQQSQGKNGHSSDVDHSKTTHSNNKIYLKSADLRQQKQMPQFRAHSSQSSSSEYHEPETLDKMDIDQSQESPNAFRPRSLQFPSFDGNKGKYHIWKQRIVAALNLQHCTKLVDMIPALQIALVEEANEGVGRDLEKLEEKPGAMTKEVWEILDKRFEDPFYRARASEKLENVRQRGRPLDDYIAEYGDLLQQAGGEDYHEDVKIRGLMRGLDDDL
ncbi:pol-like protein [Ceratocystis lukuohia]|uniref:Pol-like protein n=1 Tax=Ceratocystis lukuohia TaxID=2019550 RepID=A0ABR4MQT4_9PEZI